MSLTATADKLNSILKKSNFTLSVLLLSIFFIVLIIHLSQEVRDLDLWLHVKTGEYIITHKVIPLNDIYSFSKPGKPWINHEWLFQVIAYLAYRFGGFQGLILLQNFIFLIIFGLIFAMGYHDRNYLTVATGLFILLLASSYRFTIRPDMLSILFLVLFVFILLRQRHYIAMLPFLQIIWTNSHGFFFLGPFVIFVFALTEKQKRLWSILFFSLIATLLNPQFLNGALYPFITLLNTTKDGFIFDFVNELNRPFSFKTLFVLKEWIFLKSLIVISIFSFRFNQKKFNLTFFLLWVIFLLFALCAIRNIIYFAIIATMVIFTNVSERISYDKSLSNKMLSKSNRYYYIARTFLLLLLAISMIANAHLLMKCTYYDFDANRFKSCLGDVSLKNFPKKAVDLIVKESFPERLFNDFNSGSYLIGRTFPKRKIFIDGRTEFYGNDFLKEYKKSVAADKETLEALIDTYQFQGFFLTTAMSNFDKELARYLLESPEWKTVFFDESALLFLKNVARNENLINRYAFDLRDWSAPIPDYQAIGNRLVHPEPYLKRAKILKQLDCFTATISEAKEAIKINPRCAQAYELLAESSEELGNYQIALENYSIALFLKPEAMYWRNRYALLLYKAGEVAQAKEHVLVLLKAYPRDDVFYHAMALIYKKEGKLKKAQKMIRKAVRYSKSKKPGYLKLSADILFETKDYRKSLTLYQRVLQLEPNNQDAKTAIEKIENIL